MASTTEKITVEVDIKIIADAPTQHALDVLQHLTNESNPTHVRLDAAKALLQFSTSAMSIASACQSAPAETDEED